MNKVKEFFSKFKDLSSLGLGVGISNAIGGIFWFYMAALLGTEKYGEVSYLISIGVIASMIALIGSGNTIIVYAAKGVKIQPPMFLMVILSSLITSTILFFIFVNDFSISLYVIGYVIFMLITSNLLGKKFYRNYSKFIIAQKILMVALAVGFFYVLEIQGIILGIAVSFFPFGFLIYKEFKNTKIDFSLVSSRVGFIFNNYLLDLTNAFRGSLDKLIIAPLLGFGLLGNYQLGIQFMAMLHLVPGIIFQYTLAHDATGNQNKLLKKIIILFSVLLAILSIILAPIILPILFPKFIEAIEIIQIMSISIIPATVITTYVSKFLGMAKSKIVIIGSGLYLGVQIPAILILGTIWGVNGSAISIVIASTVHAIYFILVERLLSKNRH
ncbi:lipopolysaccharide biosynthesis protein [Nitrosarchaeum koreense]|uniref:Polysaccharide biosynthesis protein n=1 Tax=Nitrosarchaeum koreense MY1 TaxID=1001994 RepID=F9CY96_9ARCH|nr:hypothetical protein [Nitrosarchaeum koreense]EGP92874.1 Polysaccharide biosynthesis protein [Nitrosarchaeum koreense MY1]